ncbi:MAG: biopolymer transporter ExbD [Acidocella sp. 20-57-95]|nr:MAG: biopolymer transporter ExbD [Acidocella sp. 20-57-95]OYV51676.1 MAG: biopolymer transporter ExbD [Burkholderiales bacterium 21-58-4]HQT63127.1 biopolymer transporter ExbD [Acidocella sp.]HQU05515.1 biopolymer transporter ExbD [Acidocella sp.]
MGMNIGSRGGSDEPEEMVDINTTPLIDVMLVLLVMLIITIPIQLHAVNLNLPSGNPPPPLVQPEVVQIDIDFDGTVSWNGTVVPDSASLNQKLAAIAAEPTQAEVHINPNKLANYSAVIAVMAAAQRLGVTKIGIVGNEQYAQ